MKQQIAAHWNLCLSLMLPPVALGYSEFHSVGGLLFKVHGYISNGETAGHYICSRGACTYTVYHLGVS